MGRLNFVNPWSWYSIAASADVQAGQILPVALNGTGLVVWRSRADKVSVWSDRCPHRGMRLCLGGTRNEELICPYHGWVFGSDGACTHIPAHPQLTPSRAARARIFPCTESEGYIWACIGEPATPKPPYMLASGNAMSHVRTIHIAAEIDRVVAALMARPLFGSGFARGWTEDLAWSVVDGMVEVTSNGGHERFVARLEFPGLLTCSVKNGGAPVRYTALIQPTFNEQTAVHVALDSSTAIDLQVSINRNLVQLRRDLQAAKEHPALARVADRCADMMPDQARGLSAVTEEVV